MCQISLSHATVCKHRSHPTQRTHLSLLLLPQTSSYRLKPFLKYKSARSAKAEENTPHTESLTLRPESKETELTLQLVNT